MRLRLVAMTAACAAALWLASWQPGFAAAPGAAAAGDTLKLDVVDLDGRRWTLENLRGRVVLIDVWATWCTPCLAEIPWLRQARGRYPREQFEMLGISFDVSDRRTFISWTRRHAIDWPQAFDGRGRFGPAARQLGVNGVPTSFLLDRDGRVVARNLRGERLLAAIDALIRGRWSRGSGLESIHSATSVGSGLEPTRFATALGSGLGSTHLHVRGAQVWSRRVPFRRSPEPHRPGAIVTARAIAGRIAASKRGDA